MEKVATVLAWTAVVKSRARMIVRMRMRDCSQCRVASRPPVILRRRNRGGGRSGWERWRTAKDVPRENKDRSSTSSQVRTPLITDHESPITRIQSKPMQIVAGDVGGTKTILRFVGQSGDAVERRYDSASYATFDALLDEFLALIPSRATVDAACFAVAGPGVGRRA